MVATKQFIKEEKTRIVYESLTQKLWISYKDISLYVLAFIHRSIVNERPDKAPEHNERLEFLGDAVLELVITERLFLDFPERAEWELTDIRSSIVRWRNLAIIGKKLGFSEFLLLGKGEELTWGRENDYLLANCVESFIWAIYLDLWFIKAQEFIVEHVYSSLEEIISLEYIKDYKTLFQEYAQSEHEITPNYEVLEDSWPDHDKTYVTGVYIWEEMIWKGTGSSKKKSQEEAAKDAFLKSNSKK